MSEFNVGDTVETPEGQGVVRYVEDGEIVVNHGAGLFVFDETEISIPFTNYEMLLSIANKYTLHDGYPLSPQQIHVVNHLYNLGLFDKEAIERAYNNEQN